MWVYIFKYIHIGDMYSCYCIYLAEVALWPVALTPMKIIKWFKWFCAPCSISRLIIQHGLLQLDRKFKPSKSYFTLVGDITRDNLGIINIWGPKLSGQIGIIPKRECFGNFGGDSVILIHHLKVTTRRLLVVIIWNHPPLLCQSFHSTWG